MNVLTLWDWPGRRHLGSLVIVPALGVLYMLQLLNGIDLLVRPNDPSPVHVQASLVIIVFIVAIARAWQMISARDTRVMTVFANLLRERSITPGASDAAAVGHADLASDNSFTRVRA